MTSKLFAKALGLLLALAFCWDAHAGARLECSHRCVKQPTGEQKGCQEWVFECRQVPTLDIKAQALGDDQNDVDEDVESEFDVGVEENVPCINPF